MPKHPDINVSAASISDSLFSELAVRLRTCKGEIYPLHLGETWLPPPAQLQVDRLTVQDHPELYQYSPSYGREDLLRLLCDRLRRLSEIDLDPRRMLVSAGAMGALTSICGTLLGPGDECLILAPYWPLTPGIVRLSGGVPVVVPFWENIESADQVTRLLERSVSARTVCIYINSPNNPTGRILPRNWIDTIIEFARVHRLWLLSDEVYADYCYDAPHTYVYPLAPERTFSLYSFSKAFGVPGHRLGYAVGPEDQVRVARRISTHISFGAPTASQIAAVKLLRSGNETWIEDAREHYRTVSEKVANRLKVPKPQGGHFLFIDAGRVLQHTGVHEFFEAAIRQGLLVAPGAMCGPYSNYLRICFTCLRPEAMMRGVEVLAVLLES